MKVIPFFVNVVFICNMNLQENIRRILKEETDKNKFTSKSIKKGKGVLIHDLINVNPFVYSLENKKDKLKPFHLILGEDSSAIFNVFNTDEIAGLKKDDCLEYLSKHKSEKNDAFIAGLTNVYKGELFIFFNKQRLLGLSKERLIPHECLHLTRYLITFLKNKQINFKDENWWKKVKFTELTDDNEELFAEVLEICSKIVFNVLKIKGTN